jgi:hypothetical protein
MPRIEIEEELRRVVLTVNPDFSAGKMSEKLLASPAELPLIDNST